jgi:RHS repeat-associated protein
MTGVQSGSSRQNFVYDGNGNLTQAATNGITTTYSYNNSLTPNEVLSLTVPGQPTTSYGYDTSGDVTSITTTGAISTGLRYDSQARLVGVTLKDGTSVSLSYNSAGRRASYVVSKPGQPTLTERFQYRGDELGQAVAVTGTTTYTDTYIYTQDGLPLELLRQQNGTTSRYWYVLDGQGNVVALTSITGTVVDRYAYDVWGNSTSVTETVPQRLRYAGYWYDQELVWYWVSVRYYDPNFKRWLQPDPSEQDGVRTYVYVDDDPIDLSDSTGQGPAGPAYQWGMCHLDRRYCNQQPGVAAHGLYMFLIGDDINGIRHGNFFVKGLAIVDLASNALVFVPGAGDMARVGVKGITEGEIKLLMHGVEDASEHVAENTAEHEAEQAAVRTRQVHHFATNKHSVFTPQMKTIADRYGLDLDGAWNKELLQHLGRHTTKYHQFVLEMMQRAAREAGNDTHRFLELFEKYVKEPVRNNPDIMYRR